jgi:cytochrome c553
VKKLVLGIAGAAALLLVLFGRELLDLVRLMDFIEQSTAAYEADGGPWPQLADTCAGCHGVRGRSEHQAYPSLAGQPAAYVAAQLQKFASGQRADPTMGPLALTLGASEVERLSRHFAKQPAGENRSFKPDPALRDRGKELVATGGCAACHGEGLVGREQYPRLAGQGHDYLAAQLDAFAAGNRTEATGTMQRLLAAASADERKAMAAYLAALPGHQE